MIAIQGDTESLLEERKGGDPQKGCSGEANHATLHSSALLHLLIGFAKHLPAPLTDRTSSQAENFSFQSLAPLLCFSCYYYLRSCSNNLVVFLSHSCLLCQQGFKFSVSTTDFHQLESWTITREISIDLEEEEKLLSTDWNEHWQPGFLSKNKIKNKCINK